MILFTFMMRFQQQQQQRQSISLLLLAYLLVLCCLPTNNDWTSLLLFTIGAPINDDVCDATILPITPNDNNGLSSSSSSSSSKITIFNLTDATIETNETNIFSSLTNTNSVWYKFHTGPSDRCITIFTEGLDDDDDSTTSIDPHMALYEEVVFDVDDDDVDDDCTDFNRFVLIAEDDDDGRRTNSLIRAVIKPSTTYYLQIDPYYEDDAISGIVTAYTCLNNDDACNASQFLLVVDDDDDVTAKNTPAVGRYYYYYDLYWGTVEIGEINPGSGSTTTTTTSDGSENNNNNNGCTANDGWCSFETDVDNSLWYKVDGPDSGCISITTTGGDTQVAIWLVDDDDGVECGNFTGFVDLVAANDDHSESCNVGGLEDTACEAILSNITVIPGKQYYIQLDGHNGLDAFGTITVTDCSSSPSTTTPAGPTPGPTTSPTPGPTPGPTTSPTPGPTPGPTASPTPGPTPAPTPGPTSPPTPEQTCDCSGWPLGPKRRPATLDPNKGCAGYVDCEKVIKEGDIYHYKPCPNDLLFDVKNQICIWPQTFTCDDDTTCVAAVQQQP